MKNLSKAPSGHGAVRVLRFFISSTFKDMQNERSILVQHVFPELRRRLRGSSVEAIEVDLRWGVTTEEAPLEVCLAEVDRCRPYFIGLLGDRYGARASAEHLATREGHDHWLGSSLTEIEMLYGVLDEGAQTRSSIFFERSPEWARALDDSERTRIIENDAEAQTRLSALKAHVRASQNVVDYAGPHAFAEIAVSALHSLILHDLDVEDAPTPETNEDRLHEAFAKERTRAFFGGEHALSALDTWLASEVAAPLLVRAPSGAGKSALIANWAARIRQNPNVKVLDHYIGATADAPSAIALLRRLWRGLDENFGASGVSAPNTTDVTEFGRVFTHRLADAAAVADQRGQRILLLIDSLDLAATRAQLWLPDTLPTNVRMLASATDGPSASEFVDAGWQELVVAHLSQDALSRFVQSELARWGKKLSAEDARVLFNHAPASSPLFCRVLLDELRSTASYEDLAQRLAGYCRSENLSALLDQILTRLERDHGRPFVETALGVVDGCVRGAADSDIVELAGVPALAWARLRLELGENIREVAGLNVLGNGAITESIRRRYGDGARQILQRRIADHFWQMPPSDRRSQELPVQLTVCGDLDRLQACVADMDILLGLQRAFGNHTGAQALLLLQQSGIDAEELLCEAFERKVGQPEAWTQSSVDYAYCVTALLAEASFFGQRAIETVKALADGAASVYGAEHRSSLVARSNYAEWLARVGRVSEARSISEAATADTIRLFGEDHRDAIAMASSLATILRDSGETAAVLTVDERIYAARTKLLGDTHEDTIAALHNLASSASAMGQLERATQYARDATDRARVRFGGDSTLAVFADQQLANLLAEQGQFEPALEILVRLFKECSGKLGHAHLTTLQIKNDLAMIFADIGQYDTAHELQADAAIALIERLGREHPRSKDGLANLAATKFRIGDFEGAIELETEVYEYRSRVLGADHWLTLKIASNISQSFMALGRFGEARSMLERTHAARARLLGEAHPDTLATISHLGVLSMKEGSASRAKDLLRQALDGYLLALGSSNPETLRVQGCYGEALRASGSPQAAEKVLEEATSESIDVLGVNHPLTLENLGMLAHAVFDCGRVAEALQMQERVAEGREHVLGPDHPQTLDAHRGIAVMRDRLKKKGWW